MAIIKKSTNNVGEGREKKGNPLTLLVVQPPWKTVWKVLEKLKIESPYHPAILLLGIYPAENITLKDSCLCMFLAALFTYNSQNMETT